MNHLFDSTHLPITNTIYKGGRLKIEESQWYDISPTKVYSQFVSLGFEYIVLTPYVLEAETDSILKENKFTVIKSHPRCREPYFFGFRKTQLPDTYNKFHDIVMCVYFLQNSNEEIQNFVNYYTAQGIEKIFMYYCGQLSKRRDLPVFSNVEYFEWNYLHYFYYPIDPSNKPYYSRCRKYPGYFWQHYAQPQLYNMFAKKIATKCNWAFFVDLDEYVITNNRDIKTHLTNLDSKKHLLVKNYWSKINFSNYTAETEMYCIDKRYKNILYGPKIQPSDVIHIHTTSNSLLANEKEIRMLHHRNELNFQNKTVLSII